MKEPVVDLDTGEIVGDVSKRSRSCSDAITDYFYNKGYRLGYEQAVKDYDLIFEQLINAVKEKK